MKIFEHKAANDQGVNTNQAALETISEFFSIFHLVEAQEELKALEQAIIKAPEFSSREKAEDLVYFCDKLKELIEAAHQLKK